MRKILIIFAPVFIAAIGFGQPTVNYQIIWQKPIQSEGITRISKVFATNSSFLYAIGTAQSPGSSTIRSIIIKFNLEGNVIWKHEFGDSYKNKPTAFLLLPNENLVIASQSTRGPTDPQPWIQITTLYSVDPNGNQLWSNSYEQSTLFEIYDLKFIQENNTLLAAGVAIVQSSGNARDYSIASLTMNGELIWQRSVGQKDKSEDAYAVVATPDRSFIFTGNFFHPPPLAKLIKIDSTGTIQWSINYGLWQVGGYKLFLTDKNEILLFYHDWDPNTTNPYEIFLKKFNLDGNEIFEKRFGYPGGPKESLVDVVKFNDSEYLTLCPCGNIKSIDENGILKWEFKLELFKASSMDIVKDSLLIIGETRNRNPRLTMLSLEEKHITAISQANDPISNYQLYQNYPNPFNTITTIKYHLKKADLVNITIYNIRGDKIETLVNDFKTAGMHEVKWNSKNQPSGIYLCQLKVGSFTKKIKIILQK